MKFTYVKVEVLLPEAYIIPLRNELNALGVLTVGNYDHVISYTETKGYWRPLNTATPFEGKRGEISFGSECKLEFKCSYVRMNEVMAVIRAVHPYEEPVIYVMPLIEV